MLDPKLLEILACPVCRQAVKPDSDHQWLTCSQCQVRYPVENDIPIMLPDESQRISAPATEAN